MESLVIMALVLIEVALWQWRVAITMRGRLLGGAVLGLIGAIVQVTAISRVVQDIGDVAKVAGTRAESRSECSSAASSIGTSRLGACPCVCSFLRIRHSCPRCARPDGR